MEESNEFVVGSFTSHARKGFYSQDPVYSGFGKDANRIFTVVFLDESSTPDGFSVYKRVSVPVSDDGIVAISDYRYEASEGVFVSGVTGTRLIGWALNRARAEGGLVDYYAGETIYGMYPNTLFLFPVFEPYIVENTAVPEEKVVSFSGAATRTIKTTVSLDPPGSQTPGIDLAKCRVHAIRESYVHVSIKHNGTSDKPYYQTVVVGPDDSGVSVSKTVSNGETYETSVEYPGILAEYILPEEEKRFKFMNNSDLGRGMTTVKFLDRVKEWRLYPKMVYNPYA